jgi:hypothetical protein
MSAITGEKELKIAGKKYILRFTWKALSEISEKYGDSPNIFKPEVVSDIASMGLIDKYPDMTPDKIMEISPPLIPFANEIQQAMTWAYFGDKDIPKIEIDEKKNLSKTGLFSRMKMLFRRE